MDDEEFERLSLMCAKSAAEREANMAGLYGRDPDEAYHTSMSSSGYRHAGSYIISNNPFEPKLSVAEQSCIRLKAAEDAFFGVIGRRDYATSYEDSLRRQGCKEKKVWRKI